MYDCTVPCNYTDIESYQATLLQVFNTDLEGLGSSIDRLYQHLKDRDEIKVILGCMSWPPEMMFCILFSYDYFIHTHKIITDLIHSVPPSMNALCTILSNDNI